MAKVELVKLLIRGDVVIAKRSLHAADVTKGMRGVVFEPLNQYEDGNGPMVRWFDHPNMTACNVYDEDVDVYEVP